MAPNKFEKHIKKQLQEREIQPSANAWEKLSEKLDLDADAPQSKKRNYFWYSIAASFIGLLIISVVYFSSGSPLNTSPDVQIVETKEDASDTKTDSILKDDKEIEETVAENDKTELAPARKVERIIGSQTSELKDQITSVDPVNKEAEAAVEKSSKPTYFKEEIINTKILEIVATVDSLELNRDALTEAEVDDLLRNAQDEILREKLFNQNGSVDAMALLTEVEDELDKSFRDQIFESLKTGFLKVRTAVADRNK
ncbi:hypothetical protein [Maribacter sp. 2308TA10-17]|uniref:hypothetical protein n=1 Tax=Maribacter sp. 2308TA10-17 TaxID=3386276 RepID=UPI0039BD7269